MIYMQRHTGYPCRGTQGIHAGSQGIHAEAHRVSMQRHTGYPCRKIGFNEEALKAHI
jgi:hypothetical protein